MDGLVRRCHGWQGAARQEDATVTDDLVQRCQGWQKTAYLPKSGLSTVRKPMGKVLAAN
ncbi:MAG: hypothetical protein GX434_01290 [Peptococcaceae bacterium]|nr:hypothetical protein [Peptococcaceae bacterium]